MIVIGDFNAPRFFRPVRVVAETKGSTFHFNRGINIQPAIDHVLYSKEFEYRSTRVIRDSFDGRWPSDHYPLFVTISMPR